jgi:hypothetical protein
MTTPVPSSVTVYFDNPETDPSEFPRALARPDGAFLVITDLTAEPRRSHLIPAERIDCVTLVEITEERKRVPRVERLVIDGATVVDRVNAL